MRALHPALLAALVVLAAAVAGVHAAAVAEAPTASSGAPDPSFDQGRYDDHRGDVVPVTLTAPAGETVELYHEQPAGNVTLAVHDDGDGQVHLRLNTYTGLWSAAGADEVTRVDGPVERLPPAGTYRLAVNASGERASAELSLRPRSLERVGTWQAPGNVTALDGADDGGTGTGNGTFRRATGVNGSDVLVLQVDASGLAGAVAAADGANATERFQAAVAEHGGLSVRQHPATVGVQQSPAYLRVLDGPGVRVLPDAGNDTYFVVVDPAAANMTREGDDVGLEEVTRYSDTGMRFHVSATLDESSPLTGEGERRRAVVAPRDASVSTDPDDRLNFDPAANQTVAGGTNVGHGWNVTVVLAGEDDPRTDADESFRLVREVPVAEPPADRRFYSRGHFEAAFDLRSVPAADATNVTADVRLDGRSLLDDPVPVRVTLRVAQIAAASISDDAEFTAVEVNATLQGGGFVVLHAGSPDGPVVGHTGYLEPGAHDVRVHVGEPTDADELVAVAHRDVDHNEWFDGTDVDEAYGGSDATTGVALTPSPTPTTATDSGTDAPGDGTTEPSSSGSGPADTTTPGFGVVVAVLVLLLLGAALARR